MDESIERPLAVPSGAATGRYGPSTHGTEPRRGEKRKAESAVAFLINGQSIRQAAESAHLGERTLKRWLASDWFRAEYEAARQQLLTGTIDRLRSIGLEAVEALHSVLADRDSPAATKVTAARAALELLLRATELQDILIRLEKLESARKEMDDDN